MRRNWHAIPLVVVVGALAGAAIAGRPTTPENDVVIPADAVTTTSSTTVAPSTTTSVATTTALPATTTTSARQSTTTIRPTTSSTSAPSTAPRITEPARPAAAPESERGEIRVLVANGTGTPGLARSVANRLEDTGYVGVITDDARRAYDFSVVYFRDGFEPQALRVAQDLGFAPETVVLRPPGAVTNDDQRADVIVVAGPGA